MVVPVMTVLVNLWLTMKKDRLGFLISDIGASSSSPGPCGTS